MSAASLLSDRDTSSGRRRSRGIGTIVGIDIGTFSIKVAQRESGNSSAKLRVCRVVPHSSPLDPADSDGCLNRIDETLSRVWSSRNRWWPIPASCCLSMSLLEFRTLELPATSDGDTDAPKLIDEFTADIPERSEAWVVDGWATQLPNPTRKSSISYIALGMRQDFAESIAASFWRCGLDCQLIDAIPIAMARSCHENSSAVALLDWGFTSVTLTIAIDGQPYFTRILRDCGLKHLLSSIENSLQVNSEQARHLLEIYGFVVSANDPEESDLKALLAELTAPYLKRFGDELIRTWSFLQQMPGQSPSRMVVMGGGASLKNSMVGLKESVRFPIEIWKPPASCGMEHRTEAPSVLFGPTLALAGTSRFQ